MTAYRQPLARADVDQFARAAGLLGPDAIVPVEDSISITTDTYRRIQDALRFAYWAGHEAGDQGRSLSRVNRPTPTGQDRREPLDPDYTPTDILPEGD
jgi:hypothetical protein